MAKAETNRVGTQLRDARESDVIPWDWIVDERREAECVNAWKDPASYVEAVKRSYRRDRWTQQPHRIEVWSEKGTIRGTLAPVLDMYGVTFHVMHGYTSSTTAHQVAVESMDGAAAHRALRGRLRPLRAPYVGGRSASTAGAIRRRREGDPRCAHDRGHPLRQHSLVRGRDEAKRPAVSLVSGAYGSQCWELDAMSPVLLRDRRFDSYSCRLDVAAWERRERYRARRNRVPGDHPEQLAGYFWASIEILRGVGMTFTANRKRR